MAVRKCYNRTKHLYPHFLGPLIPIQWARIEAHNAKQDYTHKCINNTWAVTDVTHTVNHNKRYFVKQIYESTSR